MHRYEVEATQLSLGPDAWTYFLYKKEVYIDTMEI